MEIDPRAWMLWGVAASLPPLTGRNPLPLIVTLLAVVLVRMAVTPLRAGRFTVSGIIKLAIAFLVIGIVFNILTVRTGDRIIVTLPQWMPLLDGPLTWNAVVFGALSGIAILSLVVAGLTLAANLDWSATMRLLPDSLLGFGTAASIAFTFFPQLASSFQEIREARRIRGAPIRGARDALQVATPILSLALDRAITLSELLETRGFGAALPVQSRSGARSLGIAVGLAGIGTSAYLFVTGHTLPALVIAIVSIVAAWTPRRGRITMGRTRYRSPVWRSSDTAIAAGSVLALVATVITLVIWPEALRYEPYPSLTLPAVGLPLLVGLLGLTAPAIAALWSAEP
jgi:hypothetical protein